MKRKHDFEKDLDKIRIKLYNEMKDMTPSEMTLYKKKKADELRKKYGFKTISLTEPKSTIYNTNQTHSATMVMEETAKYETKNKK